MTDEVTPNDGSRVRHERDDARYVRRVGDPASGPVPTAGADASPAPDASRAPRATPASDASTRTVRRPSARTMTEPHPATGPFTAPVATPHPGRTPAPPARRFAGVILLIAIIAVAAAVGAAAWYAVAHSTDHVFGGRALYVDPDSSASIAAETTTSEAEREAATVLAAQPTGIWLTPERDPAGEVGATVRSIVIESKSALPVFVVYGITDRDCGGQSAGGLEPVEYLDWVGEIGDAIGNTPAIVVLEPDALALSPECDDPGARVQLVRAALHRLDASHALVYLDGGHSNWLPADEMAALLHAAGVDAVRGFATNVSNTQPTEAETAYAAEVSAELGGGTHAIIDTSRNGNGAPADGEWCNPPGRAIGETPTAVDDPVVDAVLWVKPPGESDGLCNGGPPAGEWWPERAIELTGTS
ncbi:glycoside hydrolase family 6 protein [Agromyces aerolatus]|uniref:glycoside hydrolase family 6 protein n=1 Tax=Agromyces sp. LY-1074 TaxID=3074080 RepID=UPI00286D8DCB|nr:MULTISPECIES: glycoside hydrolase family 6 protein [unclassified Agromyces]